MRRLLAPGRMSLRARLLIFLAAIISLILVGKYLEADRQAYILHISLDSHMTGFQRDRF